MNSILNLGKWLYILPFAMFGLGHFGNAEAMSGMVPIPGGAIWVYITGVAMVAAVVSFAIGKFDKLAAVLLAVLLLIFALGMHLPSMLGGNMQAAMPNFLKDLALAGGALMYAKTLAKDNAVIG